MENISTIKNEIKTKEQRIVKSIFFEEKPVAGSQVYEDLKAEGGENFFEFLTQLGLSDDPNIILLPSLHHYYYDESAGIDPVENGISSRIPFLNMIYDIMDAKTNRFLTRRTVTTMLEEVGFKIMDMAEIKGLTYFSVLKVKPITE